MTLSASVNEGQTRVGMTKNDSKASFYWHNSDKILVQTKKNDNTYSGAEFSTETATGEASASFTGEIGTDYEVGTYAIYPYDSEKQKHVFDASEANKLTYVLPAEYKYSTVGSNIFSKTENDETTYPSNPTNMPMLGTIADGKVSFKCLGGLAVIRIDKMPAAEGTLTVTASEQLSGSFEVAGLSVDNAQIATTSESVSDDNKKVTFTFSGASTESAGVFYLPLATGYYTNFQVTLSCGTDYSQTVSYSTLAISRAVVTAIPIVTYTKVGSRWFVDLGLSSGLLWGEMNIGASKATDAGTYYGNDYASDVTNWATGCCLPTKDEFEELINNCTWTWDSGKNGMKVTSKTNGNSIFLLGAGWYQDGNKYGESGQYWSSTESSAEAEAHYLHFNSDGDKSIKNEEYRFRKPIRPVYKIGK